MNYKDLVEYLTNATNDLTLDSLGRAIAEVTDDAGAREVMRAIERHSGAGLI